MKDIILYFYYLFLDSYFSFFYVFNFNNFIYSNESQRL